MDFTNPSRFRSVFNSIFLTNTEIQERRSFSVDSILIPIRIQLARTKSRLVPNAGGWAGSTARAVYASALMLESDATTRRCTERSGGGSQASVLCAQHP